jgi:cyclic lactone autoinducer peptide
MKRLFILLVSILTLIAGTSACVFWLYEPKKR